jgi:hypothetical protein
VREAAGSHNFDVLKFSALELEHAVVLLLEPYLAYWPWTKEQLNAFVACVHSLYRSSPYHSWFHAVDVMQFMSLVLSVPQVKYLFSPLEIVSTMIAGLVHDIDHDGITNKGHMALCSDRHRHATHSTQERHHLAIAQRLFSRGNLDNLINISLITSLIDATDMAHHGRYVKEIQSTLVSDNSSRIGSENSSMKQLQQQYPGEHKQNLLLLDEASSSSSSSSSSETDPSSSSKATTADSSISYSSLAKESDRHMLLIAIMKASDLSNTVRHPDTARKWGELLGNEFHLAYLREQAAHVPSAQQSFHGDPRPAHDKVQLSFFKNMIVPFYTMLSQCPMLEEFTIPLLANAQLGVQYFEILAAADTTSTPTHDNEI